MIEPGQVYKHYKGGMYEIISAAIHTETNEYLIVYKSLEDNRVWCRPHHMFTEVLNVSEDIGIPRFELVVEDVFTENSPFEDGFEKYVRKNTVLAKLFTRKDLNSFVEGVPCCTLEGTWPNGTKDVMQLNEELIDKVYIIKENDRYYYSHKDNFEENFKKETPF